MKGANRVCPRERVGERLAPGAPGQRESRRETEGAARSVQIACELNRLKGV